MTNDQKEEMKTVLAAAESQIAALKVDLAAMMKERDTAQASQRMYKDANDKNFASLMQVCDQRDDAEKARDAAHAELSQARAELDAIAETCSERGIPTAHDKGSYTLAQRVRLLADDQERDAAVKRAEAAEASAAELYEALRIAKAWVLGTDEETRGYAAKDISRINRAMSGSVGQQAVDAYRAQQEVIEASKAFRVSGVPSEDWVRMWDALDALAKVDARRGKGGR